jgi:nitrogen fixation protein NifQ
MTYSAPIEPMPQTANVVSMWTPDADGPVSDGAAIYRALTGHAPSEARLHDDMSFDTHVFASILAVAASEGGLVNERAGLRPDDLALLIARWFPEARHFIALWQPQNVGAEDAEIGFVRELLDQNRSAPGEDGRWLAAMVARRAVEPNHLWEDLGLRNRSELTRLLERHFAPLASRNTRGMRWKRFFYRTLCEDDGFLMCATPVCTDCCDFDHCFGEESGESRLAQRNRELASTPAVV